MNNSLIFPISLYLFLCFVSTANSEVLVQEDFEDSNFSSRGWYDGSTGTLSTVEHINGSTRSFECRYMQGAQVCDTGAPGRIQFTPTSEVYLSYYVKYSSNWEGSNRPYHPHEFYFLTNADTAWVGPAYTHLTVYVEQLEGRPSLALQDGRNVDANCILRNDDSFVGCNGSFNQYVFTENRSVAACNGIVGGYQRRDCYSFGQGWYSARIWDVDNIYFSDNPGPFYKNDWHFIEAYFKLNNIVNGVGVPDGVMKYWYDGQLLINYNNILFRTAQHPDMEFNQLLIAPYIGDGSPVEQVMWIDNLIVGNSLPNTDNIAPAPPTNLIAH